MSEDNFIFQLKNKIKYTKDGVPDNYSASLEFRPPSMSDYDEVTNLSQLVMNAIADVSKENSVESKETDTQDNILPTAQEIKAILFSSRKVKFVDISKCFKDLALKTCTLDGAVKITSLLMSRISIADYTRLVCEYIAFFITPSLLSEEGE